MVVGLLIAGLIVGTVYLGFGRLYSLTQATIFPQLSVVERRLLRRQVFGLAVLSAGLAVALVAACTFDAWRAFNAGAWPPLVVFLIVAYSVFGLHLAHHAVKLGRRDISPEQIAADAEAAFRSRSRNSGGGGGDSDGGGDGGGE